MLTATVRATFQQPGHAAAETQPLLVIETLQSRFLSIFQRLRGNGRRDASL